SDLAAVHAPFSYRLGHLKGKIGVIDAIGALRSYVQDLLTGVLQKRHDSPLGVVAAMVAADGNLHGSFISAACGFAAERRRERAKAHGCNSATNFCRRLSICCAHCR